MPSSALVALATSCRAYFAAQAIAAVVTPVGRRYRDFQLNQGPGGGSRVVFMPGLFDGSDDLKPMDEGDLTAPLKRQQVANVLVNGIVRQTIRELYEWRRPVTVCVWGVDITALASEEAQLQATENLFEQTVQGIYNAFDPVSQQHLGAANIEPGKVIRTYPPSDFRFGNELLWQFILKGPLFDQPTPVFVPTPVLTKNMLPPGATLPTSTGH